MTVLKVMTYLLKVMTVMTVVKVMTYLSQSNANLQGLGKTCMYCGDGINDLVALACADIGIAIGTGDAAAAAAFSTHEQSIGGIDTLSSFSS